MGYRERCFYGKSKEVKLKFPEAMLMELGRLRKADERHSISNEVTYLLGCKIEAIGDALKLQEERRRCLKQLEVLEEDRNNLWRAITMAQRAKDIDTLAQELRPLLHDILIARTALERLRVVNEEGMPINWQSEV